MIKGWEWLLLQKKKVGVEVRKFYFSYKPFRTTFIPTRIITLMKKSIFKIWKQITMWLLLYYIIQIISVMSFTEIIEKWNKLID